MYRGQSVSLILPAYNEEANIVRAVSSFHRLGLFDEILVIDNNSTDGTAGLARKSGAKVIREPRQGYGFALRRGLSAAHGDLIVLSEPDGTFFPDDVKKLLSLSSRADLVLGSRTHPAYIKSGANMGWFLRTGNIMLAGVTRWLYGTVPLTDCGCTFRIINRPSAKKILPHLTVGGSHFLPEMTVTAILCGCKIVEIPVRYGPRVGNSKITGSKIRSLAVGLKMARVIFSRRYNRLFGTREKISP